MGQTQNSARKRLQDRCDSARARVRKMIREHPPAMKDDNRMEGVPISWGPLAWLRTWTSVAMLGEGASA